jgi:hypothetical protein
VGLVRDVGFDVVLHRDPAERNPGIKNGKRFDSWFQTLGNRVVRGKSEPCKYKRLGSRDILVRVLYERVICFTF